jgi:hypothetical protein
MPFPQQHPRQTNPTSTLTHHHRLDAAMRQQPNLRKQHRRPLHHPKTKPLLLKTLQRPQTQLTLPLKNLPSPHLLHLPHVALPRPAAPIRKLHLRRLPTVIPNPAIANQRPQITVRNRRPRNYEPAAVLQLRQ